VRQHDAERGADIKRLSLSRAARIARAQYELFFSRKPQERILAALRRLISDESPAETLHRQLLDFLATP